MIGTVIGSGIFLVPGGVLRQAGGQAGPALIVWVVGGVLSLLGALAYGELGAMNPAAGGLYVYLRDAFGPLVGVPLRLDLLPRIATGSAATLAVASASYLQQFVSLGPIGQKLAAIALLAIVAAINVRSTRGSADVQNWSTAIKVGALLIMSVGAGAVRRPRRPTAAPFWPASFTPSLLSGMGLGMIGVLWAYEGWQYVTFSAGEAIDPQRTFPRAIVIGTASLVGIYLFANVGYLAALGTEGVAEFESRRGGSGRRDRRSGGGQADRGGDPGVDLLGDQRADDLRAARLLRDGARTACSSRSWPTCIRASARRRSASSPARAWAMVLARVRHVRAAADLRRLRRLDFLRARRGVCVRAAPHEAGRRASVSRSRLPVDAAAVHRRGGGAGRQHDRDATGRAAVGIGVVLLGLPVYFVWRGAL